jgi:deferrochelatase/peroxidase EfeB
MSKVDNQSSSSVSRRSFLKMMGIGGAGVVIGASGAGSVFSFKSMFDTPEDEEKDAYEFYGKVQAGITTPTQKTCNVVSLELKSKDKSAIKDMFKQWTKMAENMTDGDAVEKDSKNPLLPPVDTGEAIGLGASKLTLTFGVSKSFMKKLGLSDKIRKDYKDLPHFPNDQIDEDYSDGDIMIQACSNDEQVTFHAVHNLIRPFRDLVKVKWSQNGFVSVKGKETPRNLMAFKDGTVNPRKTNEYKDYVFINDGWAKNGTYCIIRRIQIHIETWDRTAISALVSSPSLSALASSDEACSTSFNLLLTCLPSLLSLLIFNALISFLTSFNALALSDWLLSLSAIVDFASVIATYVSLIEADSACAGVNLKIDSPIINITTILIK